MNKDARKRRARNQAARDEAARRAAEAQKAANDAAVVKTLAELEDALNEMFPDGVPIGELRSGQCCYHEEQRRDIEDIEFVNSGGGPFPGDLL